MLRRVGFVGPLADRFGKEAITFDCDDIRSLLSGLQCAYPDFRAELSNFDEVILVKKQGDKIEPIPQEELSLTFGKADEIYLAAGTKGSAAEAAAFVASYFAEGTAAYYAAYVITYVAVAVAVTATMGAVMRSMMDTPDASRSERDKRASSLFNGVQTVIEQGGAIPVIYGRHRVGSTVISTEIASERLPILTPDVIRVTSGHSYSGNLTVNDILRERLTVTSWTIMGTTQVAGATYTGSDYTIKVDANGDINIASSESVNVMLTLGYTATTSDGREATSTASVSITPTYW